MTHPSQRRGRGGVRAGKFEACDRLDVLVMTAVSDLNGQYSHIANAVVKLAVFRALHASDALVHLADAG